jgi:transcriptional regulator with XRE-family HTH domain
MEHYYLNEGCMPMNILQDFGLRLKELRLRMNLSQEMLALRSGLDRTYIGGVERGIRNISIKNIEILCNTLDIDISCFFHDERFSLQTTLLRSELNKPLGSRFNYSMQVEENLITWKVSGALHPDEMSQISLDLMAACRQLISGKVKLFIDNRKMIIRDNPIASLQEITEMWEELQRWFLPHCSQVIVLCNSTFMQDQMNRMAKRSGIIKVQQSFNAKNMQELGDEDEDKQLSLIKQYFK